MVTFVSEPIKILCNTPHGEGFLIYVQSFQMENDVWTIANREDGKIRHYSTDQITLSKNYTDQINISPKKEEEPNLDLVISELKKRNTL